MRPSTTRYVRALLLLTLSYGVAAFLALEYMTLGGLGAALWPAAGIGAAGLLIGGERLWPAILFGHLFASTLVGTAFPPWADLALAAGAAFSTVLGIMLLRRWRIASDLSNLISLLRFLMVAGLVKGVIGAALGALVVWLLAAPPAQDLEALFAMWFASEAAGVIVAGPLILSWRRGTQLEHPFYLALIIAATALVSWLAFVNVQFTYFRIWHVLPILLWSALAFQMRGATLALGVMALFACAGTFDGTATFNFTNRPAEDQIPYLQQFLAIAGLTVLVIAAIDAERRQRGEDRLRLALDAAGQGSFEIDLRHSAVSGDNVAMRLLSLPGSSIVSFDGLLELLHPDDRAPVREAILRASDRSGDGKFRVEARIPSEDGSPCWVALHGRTTFDGDAADRKAVMVRGVVRDVTVRKSAEQKVVESERFTRSILDNLYAFVGVMTPEGDLLEANRAPLEAAGISADEVIGRKFWDCYWWNYSPRVQHRLRQAVRKALTGELVRYDEQIRVAGGQLVWIDFQLAPLRDETGRITHLIPSAMDMTARMEAENARQRLISIIQATPDFIGTADVSGRISYLNPGARGIVGISPSADVSRFTITELHPPSVHDRILREAFPAAAEHGVWEGESEVIAARGRIVPVSQVIVAHRDDLGRVVEYSTIMRDISEQKRAQHQQALLLRELSHRVKNTLAVIQSIARQTLRTSPDPARFAEVFQGRIGSLAASHTLLTDTDWQGAELHAVIRRQLQPILGEEEDRLSLSGDPVLLPAEPATQLGLVLHELATNAVKHGAYSRATGRIEIAWQADSGALRFLWRETGVPEKPGDTAQGGFGSRLIDMSVRDVVRRREADSFEIRFTLDLPPPRGIRRV